MKKILYIMCCLIITFMITGCNNARTFEEDNLGSELQEDISINSKETISNAVKEDNEDSILINVTIQNNTFTAELKDNETAKTFIEKFPLTINMKDLNRNEKYYNFSENISNRSGERPEVINSGDIMIWSGNCLVLFYKTFSNSYGGYDLIGSIQDMVGFQDALGDGEVDVTFSLIE